MVRLIPWKNVYSVDATSPKCFDLLRKNHQVYAELLVAIASKYIFYYSVYLDCKFAKLCYKTPFQMISPIDLRASKQVKNTRFLKERWKSLIFDLLMAWSPMNDFFWCFLWALNGHMTKSIEKDKKLKKINILPRGAKLTHL